MLNKANSKGFTLIEVIVVMAVFLFVVGGAIVIFISILGHQRRILQEQQMLSQISYAQEYVSKALRMAKRSTSSEDSECIDLDYVYKLTHNNGIWQGIKFLNQSDLDFNGNASCTEFYFDDPDSDGKGTLMEAKYAGAQLRQNYPVALTSNDVEIATSHSSFVVNGKPLSADICEDALYNQCGAKAGEIQPRVTIVFWVKIPGNEPERVFQTTVSQRNLSVK